MRVPPSQSLTRCVAAFRACSRRLSRKARVTRVSRVPKVNTSALWAAWSSACASFMFSSVRAFIEPETSINSNILRGRARRLNRPSRSTSPSLRTLSRKVRRRSAKGPRRARMRRWPRRRGNRAGASRDSRRSASLVAPCAKRRSTSASARAAARPDSLASSASGGSSPPRPSSCSRTVSSSSPSARSIASLPRKWTSNSRS